MPFTKDALVAALDAIAHPTSGAGLSTGGGVLKAAVCDGIVQVVLADHGLTPEQQGTLKRAVEHVVKIAAGRAGDEIKQLTIEFAPAAGAAPPGLSGAASPPASSTARPPASAAPQTTAPALPGVRHVIAVGAGKGGVGKSTIAVNLAVGLARRGHAVGIVDGDIYGPSLPTLLGLRTLEAQVVKNMLQPFLVHGVKAMTIGKLVEEGKPLVWRGPMAHGAFKQLIEQTEWGELDYLIIDLPPGTGDIALSMAQLIRLTGAVIVCTPQKVAQDDAIRALRMFQQLNIEVLGVVENMSYFVADDLPPRPGESGPREYDLFGRGGAQQMAQRTGVPFLGSVPITIALRQNSDAGDPTGNFEGAGSAGVAPALTALVQQVEGQVALASMRVGASTPTLKVS